MIVINLSNKLKQMIVKMRLNFHIILFFHVKEMRYVLFSDKFAGAIPQYFFTQLLLIPFHTFSLKDLSQNYILIKFGKLVEKKGIETPVRWKVSTEELRRKCFVLSVLQSSYLNAKFSRLAQKAEIERKLNQHKNKL